MVVAAIGVVPVSSAGARAPLHCRSSGQTVARDSVGRVFRVKGHGYPGENRPIDEDYIAYGCLFRGGSIRRLGDYAGLPQSFSSPPPLFGGSYAFAIGGRFVAYDRMFCDQYYPCEGRLRVVDLRNGGVRKTRSATGKYVVKRDFVSPAGSVAWLRQLEFASQGYEIRKLTGRKEALLDRGPGIDPKSFVRHGNRISWTNAGQPRSTVLK